jgi:hypothetical protein
MGYEGTVEGRISFDIVAITEWKNEEQPWLGGKAT